MQDLRSNNEEELGKERLQTNIFRGTPYGHVALGTVAGLNAITLDDVKQFAKQMYTQANLTIGISGDAPDERWCALVQAASATLPAGTGRAARRRSRAAAVRHRSRDPREGHARHGDLASAFRSTSRARIPDFAALSVARAWLGEHRISSGSCTSASAKIRGMNYGDYAYIEAFPRGMFQFFPDPNIARQRQIFEIWIRPVVPVNAHMALRIAVHELERARSRTA